MSSADETAFAVRDLLAAQAACARHRYARADEHLFLTSGTVDTFRRSGARFLGPEVESTIGGMARWS